MTQRDRPADATRFYQPGDFIALEMGRLAAQRVTPETLEEFRLQLVKTRERNGDSKYLRMWDEIVRRGLTAVRQAFTEPSERGQVLRSTISFSVFVSKAERDAIFRANASIGMRR